MCVLSEPLHPAMGRLLLIKPESIFDKVVDGLISDLLTTRLPTVTRTCIM